MKVRDLQHVDFQRCKFFPLTNNLSRCPFFVRARGWIYRDVLFACKNKFSFGASGDAKWNKPLILNRWNGGIFSRFVPQIRMHMMNLIWPLSTGIFFFCFHSFLKGTLHSESKLCWHFLVHVTVLDFPWGKEYWLDLRWVEFYPSVKLKNSCVH